MAKHDHEPSSESGGGRTPDLLVERLALGELDAARARDVRARLEENGELDRLAEVEASNAAFIEAHPRPQALPLVVVLGVPGDGAASLMYQWTSSADGGGPGRQRGLRLYAE